jgi:uncharacterized protein YbjQ (UPF0145 family)
MELPRYVVRDSSNRETPCDEETAIALLNDDPSGLISLQEFDRWVSGQSFVQYGDLAFEDANLAVHPPSPVSGFNFIISTETYPPFTVARRLGIVASEQVATVSAVKEVMMAVSDVLGTQSNTTSSELAKARESVLRDLRQKGIKRGAQGIIGVHLNYSSIEGKGLLMLLVTGYGTAVTFAKE